MAVTKTHALASDFLDVSTLRHLNDHPGLRPLIEWRSALQARLEVLAQHLHAARIALREAEIAEAGHVASLGDTWQPSFALSAARDRIADLEQEGRIIASGLTPLAQELEAVTATARAEVKVSLYAEAMIVLEGFLALIACMAERLADFTPFRRPCLHGNMLSHLEGERGIKCRTS